MERYVINKETGEIINTLLDGDRIIKAKSVDSLKMYEKIPENERFTKLYHEVMHEIIDCNLSAPSFVIFLHLAVNLRYKSNVAKFSNGKFITRASIETCLSMPQSVVQRSVVSLIKNGLIVEANTTEGKVFIVNPFIVMIGDKVNKTVFDLFRKSKWARW